MKYHALAAALASLLLTNTVDAQVTITLPYEVSLLVLTVVVN